MPNLPIQQFRLQDPQRFNQGGQPTGVSFFNGLGQGLASGGGAQGLSLGFQAARHEQEAIAADERQYNNAVKLSYLRDSIAQNARDRQNRDILGYGAVLESEGKNVAWSGSAGSLGFTVKEPVEGEGEPGTGKPTIIDNWYPTKDAAETARLEFEANGYKASAVAQGVRVNADGTETPGYRVKFTGVQGAGGGGSRGGKENPYKAVDELDLIQRLEATGQDYRDAVARRKHATETATGQPLMSMIAPRGEGGGNAETAAVERFQKLRDANPELFRKPRVADAWAKARGVSIDQVTMELAQQEGGTSQKPKPPATTVEEASEWASQAVAGIGGTIAHINAMNANQNLSVESRLVNDKNLKSLEGHQRMIQSTLDKVKAEKDPKKRQLLIDTLMAKLQAAGKDIATMEIRSE